MTWAIADEYSLDDVLSVLTGNRVVYALVQEDERYRLERADA